MNLILALVVALAAVPQDPPKTQVLLKSSLYTTDSDLWADVREVDPSFQAIGAEVAKLAKRLEADAIDERVKAANALKALGLPAFGAIKEERDKTSSDPARRELDRILKEVAGDWPGALPTDPKGKDLTPAESEALRAEVAKHAKGLEADAIEDRGKAAGALKALGSSAYGAIRRERDKTESMQARRELDSILKDMAGPSITIPFGRRLGALEAGHLRNRLSEKKARLFQQPFISVVDGQPASIFVGEETPAAPARRRVRLDPEGKKITLEEKGPGAMVRVGFHLLVTPAVAKDGKSVSLEIAITNAQVRKPIREIDTPLGRIPAPEVVEIGVDLSPVLESGASYVAGPFPSAEEKGAPWWILIEAQILKR